MGDTVLQGVCLCTYLRVLHNFQIYNFSALGLAAMPQLQELASLVIQAPHKHEIPAADLAAPLQHMPHLHILDCVDWGDRYAEPRTYQLEGLPGRLLVRRPAGEEAINAWSPRFVGDELLAGLDY